MIFILNYWYVQDLKLPKYHAGIKDFFLSENTEVINNV